MLKNKCISAAFFAVLEVPILDNKAVIHVPILLPNKIGTATPRGNAPVEANATKIPVDADEL